MPNGGPDNCGECRHNSARESWEGHCALRGLKIRNTHWTYCADFTSVSSTAPLATSASGPVFKSAGYVAGHGYLRIPWLGDIEPSINVETTCVVCGAASADGITITVDGATHGFCHAFHYSEWWMTQPDQRA